MDNRMKAAMCAADFGYQPWTQMFHSHSILDVFREAQQMSRIVLSNHIEPFEFVHQIAAGLIDMDHEPLGPWTIMRAPLTDDGEEGELLLLFSSDEDAVLARMLLDG